MQDSTTGPAAPYTSSQTYTLAVAGPTISVTPSTLPSDLEGAAYRQTLAAAGGTAPYTFGVTSGSLPAGLTLAPTGTLSGTPSAVGSFNFTVAAQDATTGPAAPYSGTQTYTLDILKDNSKVTVTSSTTDALSDQSVTFTATVSSAGPDPSTPAGTVDFFIDGNPVASGVTVARTARRRPRLTTSPPAARHTR